MARPQRGRTSPSKLPPAFLAEKFSDVFGTATTFSGVFKRFQAFSDEFLSKFEFGKLLRSAIKQDLGPPQLLGSSSRVGDCGGDVNDNSDSDVVNDNDDHDNDNNDLTKTSAATTMLTTNT